MPVLSAIIPIYNMEPYLKQCIDSVVNQDLSDIEIVLINDGSIDKSGKICDEYANYDKRIKVIHKINGGLAEARNCGIKVSSGDYVAFLDADDFWEESFLKGLFEKWGGGIRFNHRKT